jgi:hypothetical protein
MTTAKDKKNLKMGIWTVIDSGNIVLDRTRAPGLAVTEIPKFLLHSTPFRH